ncbi:substrate-binding periplasmic protein [Salidesulfovibrio onnuriiensis]|uniref:substrate-binding periplasmic protein n=1 Tax=Salidesulfovibrio onnuriiensis TaxID=2583823 RepID=UPI0011C9A2F0|nr:transporter substrate-binding domain-containing protein [Salidesulfovibrio onnuriiensis]
MRKLVYNFIILLLLSPAPALAEDQTVTFALFARGWPPFEMMEDGEPRGMAYEIFKAILPAGIRPALEVNPAPRKRLYSPSLPVYSRLECPKWMTRKKVYLWTEPVLTLNNVLYSPANRPLEYHGLESLEGKTIGCIKHYVYPSIKPLFEAGKAKRYDVNSEQVLLRMLKAGRIDAAVMDSMVTEWIVGNMADVDPRDLHVAATPINKAQLRFAFNNAPGWKKHLPEINARIATIKKNGTLKAILEQYK